MKNLKRSTFALSILIALLAVGCGGDLGRGKHVKGPVIVTEIGDCYGGDGFFAGPRTCPIKVKWVDSGRVEFAQTWDNLMVGQRAYRECWMEGGKSQCFLNFTSRPRKMYRNDS